MEIICRGFDLYRPVVDNKWRLGYCLYFIIFICNTKSLFAVCGMPMENVQVKELPTFKMPQLLEIVLEFSRGGVLANRCPKSFQPVRESYAL